MVSIMQYIFLDVLEITEDILYIEDIVFSHKVNKWQ